jgi:hypothetical protein
LQGTVAPTPDVNKEMIDGKRYTGLPSTTNLFEVLMQFKEVAAAFAENFRVTASQIGAGTLTQVAKILQTVTEQNDATLVNLTADKAKWEKSAVALQDELLKLNRDKKLVKPEDFRVAFLELSSGFAALAAK